MASQLTDVCLRVVFVMAAILSPALTENDHDWTFCGTWRHGKQSLNLDVDLSPGCNGLSVSATESVLSIHGQFTAQCRRSKMISLLQFGFDLEDVDFCLHWEPLQDQLKLQVSEKNLTLCPPTRPEGSCCTDLSSGPNEPEAAYGIYNGMIRTDPITHKTLTAYIFSASHISCKSLCEQAKDKATQLNMVDACPDSLDLEMKDDFRGHNFTSLATRGVYAEPITTIYLPPALKQTTTTTSKVIVTFHRNNTLFQENHKEVMILNEVVEITVENEIITDLSESIRISFYHDVIHKRHSRKCVSWDTRKDPLQVKWLSDGCKTQQRDDEHTECLCNHLTYFSVLVQLEPRPVRHLLALTVITSVGCALSAISCVALIIFLCRKRKRSKEQSLPIHLGLAVSLAFLNLLFFFTGVLANMGGEGLCTWVGAALHYSLLCSFTWMGIEIFHTFWLVYMVFTPSPKAYVWSLIGFGVPAVPIIILAAVGDIYGMRELMHSDHVSEPYRMCWMKDNKKALLAQCFTIITTLVVLVSSGIVMLFLVYQKIRVRDEWRQNCVAFLSIWGLGCLFGITWALEFLNFTPISDYVLFFTCFINSFQGFFLMLRFYTLEWMRKQATGSGLGSNSTGSTRQQMLQTQEKK